MTERARETSETCIYSFFLSAHVFLFLALSVYLLWKIYAEFIKSHRREVGGRPEGIALSQSSSLFLHSSPSWPLCPS